MPLSWETWLKLSGMQTMPFHNTHTGRRVGMPTMQQIPRGGKYVSPKIMSKTPTTVIMDDLAAHPDEEFKLHLDRLYDTSKIQKEMLKHNTHKFGLGMRDDTFKSSNKIPRNMWYSGLFAEGYTTSHWPVAHRVSFDSGFGNLGGKSGFAQLIRGQFIRGIYEYIDGLWVITTPADKDLLFDFSK